MNKLKQLASRLRARFAPRQGKSGSSLAFVVTIGAALVIWVMAIMPTMTTTGTTAVKLQNSQSDYLDGKSAIEFAKSELLHIVESGVPYTFAVVRNTDTTYDIVEKRDSGNGTTTAYAAIVNSPSTSDLDDVPTDDSVAAICAVTETASYEYTIVITAYSDCEAGQKYSTTYTVSGNLLIYPEAYNQTQALPLSDFVLVDGKLGSNQVWVSTINGISGDSFTEILLPYVIDSAESYANAGKYPAVFKMTALPTAGSNGDAVDPDNGDSILTNTFTTGNYIVPFGSSTSSTDDGAIWYSSTRDQVFLGLDGGSQDITSNCIIYYNGSTTKPTNTDTGTYQVTVDYEGGTYGSYTVLPGTGLDVGTYKVDPTTATPTESVSGVGISSVSYSSGTITVTLNTVDGAQYGYYVETDSTTTESTVDIIEWKSSNTFSNLDPTNTYYFYCYVPGSLDQYGNITAGYKATYCGMVAPFTAVTEFTADEEGNCGDYLILGKSSNYSSSAFYAMNVTKRSNSNNNNYSLGVGDLTSIGIPGTISGSIDSSAVIYGSSVDFSESSYTWKVNTADTDKYTLYHNTAGYLQLSNNSVTVGTDTTNYDFTIEPANNSTAVYVSRTTGSSNSDKPSKPSSSSSRYLKISKSKVESSSSPSYIYFVKVPVDKHPNVNTPATNIPLNDTSYTIDYGDELSEAFSSYEGTLYLNGVETALTAKPDAGKYNVIGLKDGVYTSLGVLTVQRADRSAPSITVTQGVVDDEDNPDELSITVSSSNWETLGTHYFGYKAAGESDYHWFSATGNSYEFRLDYGSYTFAIYQGGTNNYKPSSDAPATKEKEIVAKYYKLSTTQKGNFINIVDKNSGIVTWYGPIYMTDQVTNERIIINVNRITKVWYRTADDTCWYEDYASVKARADEKGESVYIGINILKTNYAYDETKHNQTERTYTFDGVFQVTAESTGITNNNGYTSSMLRGSSLYFMGDGNSIDTMGNKLYLWADLLVLSNPINNNYTDASGTTTGGVIVNPYSCEDTLVYFGSDYGVFTAGTVYKVKAGTDLCSPMPSDYEELGEVTSTAVKDLFAAKQYPEINLDIAYATKDQLQHIVSGETIGWTVEGVLKNSDTSNRGFSLSLLDDYIEANAEYAVCAYVTEVSDAVKCTANRVLIAAPDDTGLTVSHDLHFTTRYLSLETSSIEQDGDIDFVVYNLGQNQTFIGAIMDGLAAIFGDTSPYSSKTLQVDYECPMFIALNSGTIRNIKAEICRYEDTGSGINLFTEDDLAMDLLMVPYSASELASLYDPSTNSLISQTPRYARIVERYVQFSGDTITFNNSGGFLRYNLDMAVYANYIYIDSTVNKIVAKTSTSSVIKPNKADIIIDTQENGYAEGEYLNLFGSGSTESYSGTLVYVHNDITYSYRGETTTWYGTTYSDLDVTIESGFYYLPAKTDGYSLSKLAKPSDGTKNAYYVDDIADYAIYVNADGTISQAYVDTGLIVSGGSGVTGFGGGSVG